MGKRKTLQVSGGIPFQVGTWEWGSLLRLGDSWWSSFFFEMAVNTDIGVSNNLTAKVIG
jgi:hypothetical protein